MVNQMNNPEPIICMNGSQPITAGGNSFHMYEWSGSGPDYLHIHYSDDEAWYILEGILTFKFIDRQIEATTGTTVFIPAGLAHTYFEAHGITRYLIIMTPRLNSLIEALHSSPYDQHKEVMSKFNSAIL